MKKTLRGLMIRKSTSRYPGPARRLGSSMHQTGPLSNTEKLMDVLSHAEDWRGGRASDKLKNLSGEERTKTLMLTTGNIVSVGRQAHKVLLVDVTLERAQAEFQHQIDISQVQVLLVGTQHILEHLPSRPILRAQRNRSRGAWWRDFFLLPEDAVGLLRDAKPPRDDGTAANVGTDIAPSLAPARLREGTTFVELLPLLVTPPPPFVFPVPPVPPLTLLVLGTELAPPALGCGRLPDIVRGRLETPRNPLRCLPFKASGRRCYLVIPAGWLAGWLACVLASWGRKQVTEHPTYSNLSVGARLAFATDGASEDP
ncbi:hypothetical protein EYF80_012419 [Liparis tanakae]|uniref:Uncharacterized protein n=1 Tax=Liparis tanakae TaxID=230148 RepID=A0A4Z2IHZ1_9TELE|nr:hypothetical protein EYF80_012419 [Liparis tanakae]